MFLGDIAASDLWKQIIDTREALAALRNSVGTVDSFVVPTGLVRTSDGPDGGNTGYLNMYTAYDTLPAELKRAIEGKTWNHPVVAHEKLFVRNAEEIACFALPYRQESSQPANDQDAKPSSSERGDD